MPIEPAGSRHLSSWTNFDFLVAQNIPVGPANIRIEGRLLNAFNTQPALSVDQSWCLTSVASCRLQQGKLDATGEKH